MPNGVSETTWSTSESPDGLCARSAPPSSSRASGEDAATTATAVGGSTANTAVSVSGVMSAAAAGSPALDGEEAGLDMSDFEELLDHLKTCEYKPGDFVFRYSSKSSRQDICSARWPWLCLFFSGCRQETWPFSSRN